MADIIMRDIAFAVETIRCAIEREGFEEVRDCIADMPDDEHVRGEPEPWQLALIEGIADAVRYAQAVREGRSYLKVQFQPGESVTWEWERGAKVDGEFRETVNRGVASLLDGKGMA